MISAPNRPICSVRSAPNTEPVLPLFCLSATPKPCTFISTRSPQGSPPVPTPSLSSIRPAGSAPKTSRFQPISRSCRCRRVHLNSTRRKISGSSCDRTGCRTESSNPSTTSSITAAMPGTPSSLSLGKSCPSPAATGQASVNHCEDWYKSLSCKVHGFPVAPCHMSPACLVFSDRRRWICVKYTLNPFWPT